MTKVFLCILFCVAVIIAPYIVENHGYVFISVGDYTIETSLLFAFIVILVLYLIIALIIKVLTKLACTKNDVSSFIKNRRTNVANSNLSLGMIALAEHRYNDAQRYFLDKTHKDYRSLANYFLASHIATKLGNEQLCKDCLSKIISIDPKAKFACTLIESDFYLKEKQYDKAIEILQNAQKEYGTVPLIYRKLSGVYLLQGNYDRLKEIISQVKKDRIFEYDDFLKIQLCVYKNDLDKISVVQEVLDLWDTVSRSFKKEPSIKGLFANKLASLGEIDIAEKIYQEGFRKSNTDQMLDEFINCDIYLPNIYEYVSNKLLNSENEVARQIKIYRSIAKQQFVLRNYSDALNWYKKVLELDSSSDDYFEIVQCYERQDQSISLNNEKE